MFGLLGALFVLTQYLQFELGYTALQAGMRVFPRRGRSPSSLRSPRARPRRWEPRSPSLLGC